MQISVNGCSLFVQDSGQGVTLVFIHGFPLSHKMWEPQIRAFSGKYRTIAYDCRGFGQSNFTDGVCSVEDHVDDLCALVEQLKTGPLIVVALSMGGYVALRFAERNPEKVLGLVLLDTRAEADSNEGKLKRFRAIKDIRINGLAPYAETSILSLFSDESLAENHDTVDLVFEMIMNSNPEFVMSTLLSLASRFDMSHSLNNIKVPTLLLVGEHDQITPPKMMEEMAKQIPDAEFCVVPEAGHMSNLENAAYVNQCIQMFLDTFFDNLSGQESKMQEVAS